MKTALCCLMALSSLVFSQDVAAPEVLPQDVEEIQEPSVQEYYSFMQEAIDDEDWWSAIDFGEIVLYHFPDSPFGQEVPYLIGMAYYRLNQYEMANASLSEYLKNSTSPRHFEEAIEMKFSIAEYFRDGGKKRLFGSHKLPAVMPAQEDALKIYDEVITTLPHHDIAIRSMLGKAQIQAYLEDFKPGVETLQLLIRRFPKHDLAAEGYLQINKVYLMQCQSQHQDPNLLELAEANLHKFQLAFPREARIADAAEALRQMKEIYAKNMFETGEFFERRNKKDASAVYFSRVVAKFPETDAAKAAREKLAAFEEKSKY